MEDIIGSLSDLSDEPIDADCGDVITKYLGVRRKAKKDRHSVKFPDSNVRKAGRPKKICKDEIEFSKLTPIHVANFIRGVECRPFLWQSSNEDYFRQDIRSVAWRELEELVPELRKSNGACAERLWQQLVATYKTEKKRCDSPSSGGSPYRTGFAYYGDLEFYEEDMLARKPKSIRSSFEVESTIQSWEKKDSVDIKPFVDRRPFKRTKRVESMEDQNVSILSTLSDALMRTLPKEKPLNAGTVPISDEFSDDLAPVLTILHKYKAEPEKLMQIRGNLSHVLNYIDNALQANQRPILCV